jgi:hypothetical protein
MKARSKSENLEIYRSVGSLSLRSTSEICACVCTYTQTIYTHSHIYLHDVGSSSPRSRSEMCASLAYLCACAHACVDIHMHVCMHVCSASLKEETQQMRNGGNSHRLAFVIFVHIHVTYTYNLCMQARRCHEVCTHTRISTWIHTIPFHTVCSSRHPNSQVHTSTHLYKPDNIMKRVHASKYSYTLYIL